MSTTGPATRVAVDAGALVTKVVSGRSGSPSGEPSLQAAVPGPGRDRAALAAALAAAPRGSGSLVTVAVPDTWLDGSSEGAQRYEVMRQLAEDQLGLADVAGVGQLAAVAALAASQRGFAAPGRYLICDAGGSGVRVAACEVSGRSVRQLAAHDTPGGGWADFDGAVRTALGAGSDPGLATWYQSAARQDRRARTVLDRARTVPGFQDAPVYSLSGSAGDYELTAGQALDCFAPTADRIRAGVAAVLGTGAPSVAVLTGGLAWFPLAEREVIDAAGVVPVVLGPEAAATGALLLASGQAELAPHGLPTVALPGHRITDGRLESDSRELPWTSSFTALSEEPLVLEEPALTLEVGGRQVRAGIPGLPSGPYRIGARPGWSGRGVVVLRPPHTVPDGDAFVIPINPQEIPDE